MATTLGWSDQELQKLIRDLNMMVVDFDGCQVGLTDTNGGLHLKKWRLITSDNRTARIFNVLRCDHPKEFKHAPIEGSRTRCTGFYPRLMCEYVMNALYPDILAQHAPAMPVPQFQMHHKPIENMNPKKNQKMIVSSLIQ